MPQRHPVDLVRVALGLALVGLGFLIAQRGELPVFERDVFRLVNDLPAIVYPVVWAVMQLGNVLAVPTLSAVAALTGRFRMARDMLISGLMAYVAADLVKRVVGRERPAGFPVGAELRDGTISGIGFISGHAAVAAALAAAAAPYLSRRARRAVWVVAWSVALARVYVGAHLPLDVVCGVAAGWALGSLVHWAFGVPRWAPTTTRVGDLLHRFGLPVRDIRRADVPAHSSHPFEAVDERGRRLYVKVLDPDRFERDWLYRLYRLLAVRDIKDDDAVAPLGQQAEHEAVAAMIARERGVRVPAVLLARGTDRGAVVVQEYVVGRTLDDLPPAELTAGFLQQIWEQVVLLRDARVAHHDLVASSVLVDAAGRPWIVDFGNARTGADDDMLDGDVAELLASLALRADPCLVADSVVAALGPDVVAAALPGIAPLTLTAATRMEVSELRDRLSALRRELRRRLGLPDPTRPEFGRVGIVARLAVATGAAVILVGVPLLAGSSAVVDDVQANGWRWLGGALTLAVLARTAMATAALLTVERRLALGRTFRAMMVAEGATLLHGPAGSRRAAARFLERAGVLPESAERAIDRFSGAAVGAAALVFAGTFVLALVENRLSGWRPPAALEPAVPLAVAAWALVLVGQWSARQTPGGTPDPTWRPRDRDRRPVAREAWTSARYGGPGRWRWWMAIGWSALGIGLEGAALAAALHGVGADVPLLATATVYAGLHLPWSVFPVTGAPGAADVALMLALTALGAPLASACAGVIVFRLFTFWLPAGLGSLFSGRFENRFVT
jgi:membrane-associated phospholipid phosphatase/uncharacterized membrane protein YbhN (UPF0104 family)